MSKSIYEEVLERVWEDCSRLDLNYVSKHNLMDDLRIVKQALEQAQKQEKLLELYKVYLDLTFMYQDDPDINSTIIDIVKQIKELENEKEILFK